MDDQNLNRPILLISYGNPLRGDDGVAEIVLDELANNLELPDDIRFIRRQQLDIVDAEAISSSKAVVFIDAHVAEDRADVELEEILPSRVNAPQATHISAPEDLIRLTEEVYNTVPSAFVCAVRGYDFSFGTQVSEPALRSVHIAADKISRLLKKLLETAGSPD